ncbi:MAG: FGGY-family carbohydrate kinase [Anaerolineales bacterium]|nr:FGGY-family carbohydrate kinase [Anaerolineales bacterium]
MNKKIIAYDLGTGGNKASLYDSDGVCLSSTFCAYDTLYPQSGMHEQRPADWWDSIVNSTRQLMTVSGVDKNEIECLAISGHSLGVVPIDKKGRLLRESTPIWSDSRAGAQADSFFEKTDEDNWYMTTGNGFPAKLYSVFKILWYLDNEPDVFKEINKVIGTKDYINFKLTGQIKTDYSYASGCGVYDLKKWKYSPEIIKVSGLDESIFPEIVPSTEIIGELTPEAAQSLGLLQKVKVACGGVDNSCMALGARNNKSGRVYLSLGSSAWIAVSADNPVLDVNSRPFVFSHVIPGMFTSAVSIFSAGNSFRWLRDNICPDLVEQAAQTNQDVYDLLGQLAEASPPGANKLLFNPSLAGGSSQEPNANIRGAFSGLDLGHSRADLVRAGMEGIAMNLGFVLKVLKNFTNLSNEMVIVGGGSKSSLWRQIFADVFEMNIVKTNIGEEAGSLGAAALAAIGCGLWKDFSKVDQIHNVESITEPILENNQVYKKLEPVYEMLRNSQAEIGESLSQISI